MPQEIASAYLTILPSFEGLHESLDKELGSFNTTSASNALDDLGDQIEEVKSSGKGIGDELSRAFDGISSSAKPATDGMEDIAEAASKAEDSGAGIESAFDGVGDVVTKAFDAFKEGKSPVEAITTALGGSKEKLDEVTKSGGSLKKVLSNLKGGLISLGAGLAVAGLTVFIDSLNEAAEKSKTLKTATDGLGESASILSSKAGLTSVAFDDYGAALAKALPSVDDLINKQAALAQELGTFTTDYAVSAMTLSSYGDTIRELTNRHDENGNAVQNNAQQQALLIDAIDQVNKACGTEYEVIDAANGVIADQDGNVLNTTAALDQYIAKTNAAALAQEFAAAKAKVMAQAYADQGKYNSLLDQRNQKERELADILKSADYKGLNGESAKSTAVGKAAALKAEIRRTTDSLNELQPAVDSANAALDILDDGYEKAALAAQGLGTEWQNFAYSSTDAMNAFASRMPLLDQFCAAMEAAGIDVNEFSTNSSVDMQTLADNFDGSLLSIASLLSQYGYDINNAQIQSQLAFSAMSSDADFMSQTVQSAFEGVSFSKDDFIKGLEGAGVSVSDFATLNDEQLAQVVAAYGEDLGSAVDKVHEFVEENKQAGTEAAQGLSQSMADGMAGCGDLVYAAANSELAIAFAQFSGNPEFATTGGFITQGMAQGMLEDQSLVSAAGPLSTSTIEALRAAFGAHSPATMTIPIGHDLNEGIAQGMTESRAATDAATVMATNITAQLSEAFTAEAFAGIGSQIGGGIASGMASQSGAVQGAASVLEVSAISGLQPAIPEATSVGLETGSGFSQGVLSATGQTTSAGSANVDAVIAAFNTAKAPALDTGRATGSNFAVGIWDKMGEASRAGADVKSSALGSMSGGYFSAYSKGQSLAQGFVDGILSKKGSAGSAAAEVKAAGTIAMPLSGPTFSMPLDATEMPNIAPIAAPMAITPIASPMAGLVEDATSELGKAAISGFSNPAPMKIRTQQESNMTASSLHEVIYSAVYSAISSAMPKETNLVVDGKNLSSVLESHLDSGLEKLKARRAR